MSNPSAPVGTVRFSALEFPTKITLQFPDSLDRTVLARSFKRQGGFVRNLQWPTLESWSKIRHEGVLYAVIPQPPSQTKRHQKDHRTHQILLPVVLARIPQKVLEQGVNAKAASLPPSEPKLLRNPVGSCFCFMRRGVAVAPLNDTDTASTAAVIPHSRKAYVLSATVGVPRRLTMLYLVLCYTNKQYREVIEISTTVSHPVHCDFADQSYPRSLQVAILGINVHRAPISRIPPGK